MTQDSQKHRTQLLCVDDDPSFLKMLGHHLAKDYEITTFTSGTEALAELSRNAQFAVIVADMNMPEMDGVTLLTQAREIAPTVVRVMLTGEADQAVAAMAINAGEIFRFLTKDCMREELLRAIGDSVEQHRLLTAERALLEGTLMGTIEALMDALAVVNPLAFSRAHRIRRMALDLAQQAALPPSWILEAAALLSQLGYLAVPQPVLERLLGDGRLSNTERRQLDRVHTVACDLLKRIPRLEPVIDIISHLDAAFGANHEEQGISTEILRLAIDFDRYLLQIGDAQLALDALQAHVARYSPTLLAMLATHVGTKLQAATIREVPLNRVTAGMVLMHEVRTETGALLLPAEFEVTAGFLERIQNLPPGIVDRPVRVRVYVRSALPR